MTKYELTFLLNTEEETKIVKDLITSLKGEIATENKWGKKTLSYPIGKNKFAFYFNYQINIDKKNIQELKKKLNFEDKIMRYLLLQVEEKKLKVKNQKSKVAIQN